MANIMTAKEVIEHFTKLPQDEEVLITWWEQKHTPDYDFEVGQEQLEQCVGHTNDWMASNNNEEDN